MSSHTGPLVHITDINKIPDLLDFFITKNISPRYVQINSSAVLSSDYSPVIATVSSAIIENSPNGLIRNQLTNWQLFREVFNHSTSASISLKTKEDIETATEYLNTSIINDIRSSTPTKTSISKYEYPHYVLNKITEKRRLRRVWQTHRTPDDKRKLNVATLDKPNTTIRHELVSDDGSAVVNVLGCERSEPGFRIPATGVRFYFHAPRNGGKISSTPAATSTAPSDNYSGLGPTTTTITRPIYTTIPITNITT